MLFAAATIGISRLLGRFMVPLCFPGETEADQYSATLRPGMRLKCPTLRVTMTV